MLENVVDSVVNTVIDTGFVGVSYCLDDLCVISRGSYGIELLVDDIIITRVSGSIESLGKSWVIGKGVDTWPGNPESLIHVRVVRKDVLLPGYLYYLLQYLHSCGYFKRLARGSVQQFIRVADVKRIAMGVSL